MATTLESEFKDLSLQDDSIKPGLFHLSLNLLYQPDSDTLNERKTLLEIQLKDEHQTVHLILKNLIALINHRLPRSQNEVRSILESIRKENPKHLNTLANLEVVYKELHRHIESDRCRKEVEDIMCSNENEAMELKAQCVLEQAYSLIIEEATNHEGIANHRLRDSLKILTSEHNRSSGERKDYLDKALRYAEQASSCVLNAMYCDRPDVQLERKIEAIEKFLQGLKMLESMRKEQTVQYHIWKFYLGLALNRYDSSIFQTDYNNVKQSTRKELNTEILQIFWSTISNLKSTSEEGLYVARSYAYIGHLVISRKDIVEDIVKSIDLNVRYPKQLVYIIENPLQCFPQALEIRKNDIHVLNRFGRSLRNQSRFHTSLYDKKLKLLWDAHHYLTLSIQILPQSNWFAYVTRMHVRSDLAQLCTGRDAKPWLEEARNDGVHCYHSKATDVDLGTLAKVCQMLAKFPDVKRYGPKFVKNNEYIYEAIHYLNYALQLGGFVNFVVVRTLSTCLFEIGEHRTAIEWMKRAMHLARKSSKPDSLTRIVEYILSLYNAKSSESFAIRNSLLNEILFWIGQGKAKFSNIETSISNLCKYNADGMFVFINYLLNYNQSNSESRRNLISSCLDALKYWQGNKDKYRKSIKECEERLNSLLSPAIRVEQDIQSSAEYTVPDILMPFSLDAKIQHSKFKFDFFISHSNVNRDWVNNYLLHQLETKLHENDVAFKGCIADRDFTPGSTIISNIRYAVEQSCKVIFVITEDFIKSRWCDFEVDQALVEMLSTKKEDCLIPILLEKITDQRFPKKICHITYLDLTDESKHFQEVMKLKRALSFQFD